MRKGQNMSSNPFVKVVSNQGRTGFFIKLMMNQIFHQISHFRTQICWKIGHNKDWSRSLGYFFLKDWWKKDLGLEGSISDKALLKSDEKKKLGLKMALSCHFFTFMMDSHFTVLYLKYFYLFVNHKCEVNMLQRLYLCYMDSGAVSSVGICPSVGVILFQFHGYMGTTKYLYFLIFVLFFRTSSI